MNATFRLDRARGTLFDGAGRRFDPRARVWSAAEVLGSSAAAGEVVDEIAAATWLQRDSGHPRRTPVGVIGPRAATAAQCAAALEVGEWLARCGFVVVCGGRQGVMEAVCEGVARGRGLSIGLLPETDPGQANPFVSVAIATGIGEARNALIARASFCLVAIGDSFGTLSEVALGRHFGKCVIGLEGAAQVEGVQHVAGVMAAIAMVARVALALEPENVP